MEKKSYRAKIYLKKGANPDKLMENIYQIFLDYSFLCYITIMEYSKGEKLKSFYETT